MLNLQGQNQLSSSNFKSPIYSLNNSKNLLNCFSKDLFSDNSSVNAENFSVAKETLTQKSKEKYESSIQNQKTGKYSLITQEMRKQLIEQVINKRMSMHDAAEFCKIKHSTAKAILKTYKVEGRIGKKKNRIRKSQKLVMDDIEQNLIKGQYTSIITIQKPAQKLCNKEQNEIRNQLKKPLEQLDDLIQTQLEEKNAIKECRRYKVNRKQGQLRKKNTQNNKLANEKIQKLSPMSTGDQNSSQFIKNLKDSINQLKVLVNHTIRKSQVNCPIDNGFKSNQSNFYLKQNDPNYNVRDFCNLDLNTGDNFFKNTSLNGNFQPIWQMNNQMNFSANINNSFLGNFNNNSQTPQQFCMNFPSHQQRENPLDLNLALNLISIISQLFSAQELNLFNTMIPQDNSQKEAQFMQFLGQYMKSANSQPVLNQQKISNIQQFHNQQNIQENFQKFVNFLNEVQNSKQLLKKEFTVNNNNEVNQQTNENYYK